MLFVGEEYPRNSTKIVFSRIPVMYTTDLYVLEFIPAPEPILFCGEYSSVISKDSPFIELEYNLYNYTIRLSLKVDWVNFELKHY